jgi:diketogulonate reductase-like aldo/keto reductase
LRIACAANEQRIKENLDTLELTPDDMAKIANIDKNKRFNDPSTSFGYVFFADEKPAYKSALDAITNAGMKAKAAAQSAIGQSA